MFGGLGGTTGGRERGFGLDVSFVHSIERMLLHYHHTDLTILLLFFIFQQILGIEMVLVSCIS